MGFLTGIKRSVEDPSRPLTDETLLELFGGEATESGEVVTPQSAYRSTAVYRSIALLAGLLGALPRHAYRRGPDGGRIPVNVPVISDPHPDKTAFEVWEWAGQSLLGWGNVYMVKVRDRMRHVRWLDPVDPWRVRVERNPKWITGENQTGKRFFVASDAGEVPYSPWEMLHIPGLSYDGLVGMSPIQQARQAIGVGQAAQKLGARMMGRGGYIPGVLATDRPLTQDQAEALEAKWRARTAGIDNAGRVPVMHSGLKYTPIALPPADTQFLEAQRYSVTEVARLFGLPPHLVGDVEKSTSWGTGIEHQNMQMLMFTADPWLVRIEQRLSREVAYGTSPDVYVKFNRAALLRADTNTRYLAYQRAVTNGWMNPDEIRALEDMDPIPDGAGAQFFRPGNLLPLDTDQEVDGE